MQKVIRLISVFLILVLSATSVIIPLSACSRKSLPDDMVEVNINDKHVDSFIRYAVNKLEGPLNRGDLRRNTRLNLDNREITSLASLRKLQQLNLSENQITDISVLQRLDLLGYINLEDNQIIDIKPLVDNSGIGVRDNIYLKGNPLNEVSLDTYVPALEKRTARVTVR